MSHLVHLRPELSLALPIQASNDLQIFLIHFFPLDEVLDSILLPVAACELLEGRRLGHAGCATQQSQTAADNCCCVQGTHGGQNWYDAVLVSVLVEQVEDCTFGLYI